MSEQSKTKQKPKRTWQQQRQFRARTALGALAMLRDQNPFGPEDEYLWRQIIEAKRLILDRQEVRSVVRKFRTRYGNKRYPVWWRRGDYACAYIGDQRWSVCGLSPLAGAAVHGPKADEPLEKHFCPTCTALAMIAGVLQHGEKLEEGRWVVWSRVPDLSVGMIPASAAPGAPAAEVRRDAL